MAAAGAVFCTGTAPQSRRSVLLIVRCSTAWNDQAEIAKRDDPPPSIQPAPPGFAAATDGRRTGPGEGGSSGALGSTRAGPAWSSPPRPAATGPAPTRPPVAPVRRGFWERVTAGWELSVRCLQLMKAQPGLLAVPVISTVVIVVLFILAAVVASALPGILALLWWLAALGVMAGIGVGNQAVIVHRVGSVLHGGTCTNAQAFAAVVPQVAHPARLGRHLPQRRGGYPEPRAPRRTHRTRPASRRRRARNCLVGAHLLHGPSHRLRGLEGPRRVPAFPSTRSGQLG